MDARKSMSLEPSISRRECDVSFEELEVALNALRMRKTSFNRRSASVDFVAHHRPLLEDFPNRDEEEEEIRSNGVVGDSQAAISDLAHKNERGFNSTKYYKETDNRFALSRPGIPTTQGNKKSPNQGHKLKASSGSLVAIKTILGQSLKPTSRSSNNINGDNEGRRVERNYRNGRYNHEQHSAVHERIQSSPSCELGTAKRSISMGILSNTNVTTSGFLGSTNRSTSSGFLGSTRNSIQSSNFNEDFPTYKTKIGRNTSAFGNTRRSASIGFFSNSNRSIPSLATTSYSSGFLGTSNTAGCSSSSSDCINEDFPRYQTTNRRNMSTNPFLSMLQSGGTDNGQELREEQEEIKKMIATRKKILEAAKKRDEMNICNLLSSSKVDY